MTDMYIPCFSTYSDISWDSQVLIHRGEQYVCSSDDVYHLAAVLRLHLDAGRRQSFTSVVVTFGELAGGMDQWDVWL